MNSGFESAIIFRPDLFKGKRALVTGAARGIGAAIAWHLARSGAEVLLMDGSNSEGVVDAIRADGGQAESVVVDVTERRSIEAALKDVKQLDVLITSAGVYGEYVTLDAIDEDEFDRVMGVNLKGAMWSTAAALPLLRESAGSIVFIGSTAGKNGGVSSGPHYVASKGALHAVVKWLAKSEAEHGIRVNAVAPGAIDTEMIAGRGYSGDYCPLGRLGTVDDVASAATFLASSGASYMTGTVIDVNGGFYMA